MGLRIGLLSLLVLCIATIPSMADTVYDNGPINGTTDGWTINFGFVVSDTFIIGSGGATVDGLVFGAWLYPTDILRSAEVSITSSEFGGTTYFDGTVNFTQSDCTRNQNGYDVCVETGTFPAVNLGVGTYWLNLQNALAEGMDDPVYWDENSGPSQASQNSLGTIPSESFTILGTANSTTTSTGTTPEPSSVMLFGSGMLGLAAVLRSKLF